MISYSKTFNWIISNFKVLRENHGDTFPNATAASILLSFGDYARDDQGQPILSPIGTLVWIPTFAKEYQVSYQDLGEFLSVALVPDSEYAPQVPAALTGMASVDDLMVSVPTQFVRWALDTGKWQV